MKFSKAKFLELQNLKPQPHTTLIYNVTFFSIQSETALLYTDEQQGKLFVNDKLC